MAYAFNLSVLEAIVGGVLSSRSAWSVYEVYILSKKEAAAADNKSQN